MADAYDLSKLGPREFENIANFLALKALGLGHTGFGPGLMQGATGILRAKRLIRANATDGRACGICSQSFTRLI
jgi:hypothetical protein